MDPIEQAILEYLDEDIPTTPGGKALIPCCHEYSCEACGGSGWKQTMLRKLSPYPRPVVRRIPREDV